MQMHQKKHESSWYAKRAGLIAVALMLGVVMVCGNAASSPEPSGALPAVPNRGTTQVYDHTYDEVFQASLDAIERMGVFVAAKDKDKGTISGKGKYLFPGGGAPITFEIHIEAVSTKPETRLTTNCKATGLAARVTEQTFVDKFPIEVQKVLSTYH
jgi:hypothetical protein